MTTISVKKDKPELISKLYKELILSLYARIPRQKPRSHRAGSKAKGTRTRTRASIIEYKTQSLSLEDMVKYHKQLCQLLRRVQKELRIKVLILEAKTPVGRAVLVCTRQQRSFLRKKYRVELETDKVWIIKARKSRRGHKFRKASRSNGH